MIDRVGWRVGNGQTGCAFGSREVRRGNREEILKFPSIDHYDMECWVGR